MRRPRPICARSRAGRLSRWASSGFSPPCLSALSRYGCRRPRSRVPCRDCRSAWTPWRRAIWRSTSKVRVVATKSARWPRRCSCSRRRRSRMRASKREAAEHRAQAEGERARNEQAQRAGDRTGAGDRRRVRSAPALSKLAAKDLTYRMPARHSRRLSQAAGRFQRGDRPARRGDAERDRQHRARSTPGPQEISAASDDLSRRTEQQAASLEETAAALDEITATVQEIGRRRDPCAPGGRHRRRGRQEERRGGAPGGRGDGRASPNRRSRSARSSASSTRSPSRPICSRSTPASRRRGRARPAAASRSSPPKCARWPSVRRKRPRRSRA